MTWVMDLWHLGEKIESGYDADGGKFPDHRSLLAWDNEEAHRSVATSSPVFSHEYDYIVQAQS